MDTDDRWIAVPERTLGELIDLVERALCELEPLQASDPLVSAMRGVLADARTHMHALV
jgi:hypothetical protein